MRLTKIMQEYIKNEITKRIEPRYEDMRQAAENRTQAFNDYFGRISDDLNQAATAAVNEFLAAHPEYEDVRWPEKRWVSPDFYHYLRPKKEYQWSYCMDKEIDDKYKETIVALELGGTKADLDEMLNNI